MSWRYSGASGSSWNFLQSVQYGRTGNPSIFSSPDILFKFEADHILSNDDSMSAEEDLESSVLFGSLKGSVVGLRYYTGVVNNNEMVALQREPDNQYDHNAVKVNNVNGDQVGHIKKELAAALAFIMDRKLARIEGIVPYGARNAFIMPVNLSFWGSQENKQAVLQQMQLHGFKLAPGFLLASSQFNFASGPNMKASVIPAVQMTTEQLKTEFDKLFEDLKEDDKTQMMEPSQALGTVLLPHQKHALAWMVSRENSNELPPFWEQRNKLYYNTLTNFAEKEKPDTIRGGILADDMGLGKTLSVIALLLTNFHGGQPFPIAKASTKLKKESVDVEMYGETSKHSKGKKENPTNSQGPSSSQTSSKRPKRKPGKKAKYTYSSDSENDCQIIPQKIKASAFPEEDVFAVALSWETPTEKKKSKTQKGPSTTGSSIPKTLSSSTSGEQRRTTLIICPLSVLSNWIDQFEQHVKPEVQLNICVYYGPERSQDPNVLSQQDVVLTTYTVVTHDYTRKTDSPLHKVKWLRVVLDEGHTIRNPNAQQTKATHSLVAERRWILTGTPIQNSLKDLWSLLSFLKLKPFTDREWWHRTIQRPVTMGDQGGLSRLQALIKNTTLRRTKTTKIKGKPVLQLPGRKVFIQHIELSDEEQRIYNSVRDEGKAVINKYFNEGTILTNYADVLVVLVRLRQLCCHPHLVSSSLTSTASTKSGAPGELYEKLVNKMKIVLSSGSDEECAICLESLNMPVITHCAHVFCKPCICQVIHNEQPNAKCPLCRREISGGDLVECPEEESDSTMKQDQKWMSSSKINALLQALIKQRNKDPQVKSIVVSQFTGFLTLIETAIRESGFIFTRLDGSLTQKKRTEAIQSFQSSDAHSPTIMLLSLKAGGVGLNLTAASRLYLMDPAWNPAAEEQCFDRCHRLGQTKDVIITKYVVKDSVEENMLKIQDKKREVAAGAFGTKKPTPSEIKQARIAEIKTLVDL
uniref:Helicase like transcription factor n=1 Tax=Leptobrachium leishanense TaxID=445787 RepID=A0A8C5M7S6_9ANUR